MTEKPDLDPRVYWMYEHNPSGCIGNIITHLMVIGSLGLLLWIAWLGVTNSKASEQVFSILFMVSLVLSFILCSRARLVLHENGLEIYNTLSHKFYSWTELSHIGTEDSSAGEIGGLYTSIFLKRSGSIEIGHIVRIPQRRGQVDVDELVMTPFGQSLLVYAPDLIERSRNPNPKSDRE